MSVGFTMRLTEEQLLTRRAEKLLARQKELYGECGGGHPLMPGNMSVYDGVQYCDLCIESGRKVPTTLQSVYFIADGAGHVKIGYSLNVSLRLIELQRSNAFELRVLGLMAGGRDTERALHERFAKHRIRGEWFYLMPEIVDYISALRNPNDAAPERRQSTRKQKVAP